MSMREDCPKESDCVQVHQTVSRSPTQSLVEGSTLLVTRDCSSALGTATAEQESVWNTLIERFSSSTVLSKKIISTQWVSGAKWLDMDRSIVQERTPNKWNPQPRNVADFLKVCGTGQKGGVKLPWNWVLPIFGSTNRLWWHFSDVADVADVLRLLRDTCEWSSPPPLIFPTSSGHLKNDLSHTNLQKEVQTIFPTKFALSPFKSDWYIGLSVMCPQPRTRRVSGKLSRYRTFLVFHSTFENDHLATVSLCIQVVDLDRSIV